MVRGLIWRHATTQVRAAEAASSETATSRNITSRDSFHHLEGSTNSTGHSSHLLEANSLNTEVSRLI